MSDLGSASANSLNIQQLFSSLTSGGTAAPSSADPDAFGQNLPTDPADSATSGTTGTSKAGTGSTTTSASNPALSQAAKAKRDAALAQSRLDLLGLQEQSGKSKAHGASHGHGHHGPGKGATAASSTTATTSSTAADPTGAVTSTGITAAANEDNSTSGLSTLLLAQMAAA